MRWLIAFLVLFLIGCATTGRFSKSKHPRDVEDPSISLVSSGACDGPPPTAVDDFFSARHELAQGRPDEGTSVILEGTPSARLVCTLLACNAECCENACGYSPGCVYVFVDAHGNRICLDHPSFECGGTDCSPWCAPLSTRPEHTYRFVGTITYPEPDTTIGTATLVVESFCRINEPADH